MYGLYAPFCRLLKTRAIDIGAQVAVGFDILSKHVLPYIDGEA